LFATRLKKRMARSCIGIHQARAVDEIALSSAPGFVETRQVFRGHREVGIQDHQKVASRVRKANADGIALALAGLLE